MKGTFPEEAEQWRPKPMWALDPCPLLRGRGRSGISGYQCVGRFVMERNGMREESNRGFFQCV